VAELTLNALIAKLQLLQAEHGTASVAFGARYQNRMDATTETTVEWFAQTKTVFISIAEKS
jgi:hypothetical protein